VIWVRVSVNSPSSGEPAMKRPATTAASTPATPSMEPRWMAGADPERM
jgi:hypothetical protein